MKEETRSLLDTVRESTIPVAMIGAGLWLLLRNRGQQDGYDVEFIPESEAWDAGESTDAAPGKHRRFAAIAERSRTTVDRNPLLIGAAALATGALLGAMIPETDREHELFGTTRDRLADRARDLARDGAGRAKNAARAATHAATAAAKNEVRTRKTDIGRTVGIGGPEL